MKSAFSISRCGLWGGASTTAMPLLNGDGLSFGGKCSTRSFSFLLAILLATLSGKSEAQDVNCDYFQSVVIGQTYYVYSPNYPNNYSRGITCRWQAVCPANTQCRLQCPEVNLPPTTGCVADRLLISRTGDSALTGADKYCGLGSLDVSSVSNSLSVGFISTQTSIGGRFLCTLAAATAATPNPNNCQCGWKKTNRIVGGQETGINEYPMMAGLVDLTLRIVYCGGTVISTRWVLTAAHCVKDQANSNVAVLYGEHNIRMNDSPATTLVQAERFSYPSQYSGGYEFDIGLVRTAQDIVFSDRVGPACLPFKFSTNNLNGVTVEALGWGTQSFAGADSDYLQKVGLQVVDKQTCQASLGPVVTDGTICTYAPGKDTCQHDSGGPLLYQDPSNGRLYIAGVIVGGYGCATNRPGLNTRVTAHLAWIVAQTADASYCRI